MTGVEIAGQVISVIAMALIILSFQCKKRALYYVMQVCGNVFFAVSFLLLGNVAGCLMNAIGIVRGLIMLGLGEKKRYWALVLINVLFVGGAVFAGTVGGDGWACLLSFAAQTVGTFSMWYCSDKALRWVQLCAISPLWMLNNTLITFSIGGIICEAFSMISTIIYLLRVKNRKKSAQGA